MRKHQIISILLCAATVTGAAFSCGKGETSESGAASSAASSSKAQSAEPKAASNDDSRAASNESSATPVKTEEPTEPTESKDAAFDYYDDLNKEYEENGTLGFQITPLQMYTDIGSAEGNAYYRNGKLYFIVHKRSGTNKESVLVCYDIEKEEMTEQSLGQIEIARNSSQHGFAGSKLTFRYNNDNGSIISVYDIDDKSIKGNIAADVTYIDPPVPLPSGSMIQTQANNNNSVSERNGLHYYPLGSDEEVLPLPTITDSHGLEQTLDSIEFQGAYKNKVYYTGSYDNSSQDVTPLYCLDLDTKEWTSYEVPYKSLNYGRYVGKYLLFGDMNTVIYNMETNETVGQYRADGYEYFGGDAHIDINGSNISLKKIPLNSDENGTEVGKIEVENGGKVFPVNGKYYLYVDKAGAFLRDYEGSEAEKQIILFNN